MYAACSVAHGNVRTGPVTAVRWAPVNGFHVHIMYPQCSDTQNSYGLFGLTRISARIQHGGYSPLYEQPCQTYSQFDICLKTNQNKQWQVGHSRACCFGWRMAPGYIWVPRDLGAHHLCFKYCHIRRWFCQGGYTQCFVNGVKTGPAS
jgi:hypothetical protein